MLLKREVSHDRLLGVVYTPAEVALEITERALSKLSSPPRSILEPSVGDGAFFRSIEIACDADVSVHGVDVNAHSIDDLKAEFPWANLTCGDFIDYAVRCECENYDLVIGNPPYIRRHNFSDEQRTSIGELSNLEDYPYSQLKNAWVAFVVAANRVLSESGVLAFVVPYELLNVNYGQFLQGYLLENFEAVEVFAPQDKAFRELDQDAVAIIASKHRKKGAKGFTLNTVKELAELEPIETRAIHFSDGQADSIDLNSVFFDGETAALLHQLRRSLPMVRNFADSSAGVVTAANDFFILDSSDLAKFELSDWARPILKKSSFLPAGPTFSHSDMAEVAQTEPAFLIDFFKHGAPKLSSRARSYIARGEYLGLDKRYKPRHRKPWYKIPIVEASDGIFFKRSHSFPRLTVNAASALVTDTGYQVTMKAGHCIRDLCFSFYNSLTLLFCEMDGRFYGGGVLELTPNEFKGLPLHFQHVTTNEFQEFQSRYPRSTAPSVADFALNDERLARELGLSDHELGLLQSAYRRVRDHRLRHS